MRPRLPEPEGGWTWLCGYCGKEQRWSDARGRETPPCGWGYVGIVEGAFQDIPSAAVVPAACGDCLSRFKALAKTIDTERTAAPVPSGTTIPSSDEALQTATAIDSYECFDRCPVIVAGKDILCGELLVVGLVRHGGRLWIRRICGQPGHMEAIEATESYDQVSERAPAWYLSALRRFQATMEKG